MEGVRYTAVKLPELRREDGLAPIRQELGIKSFGINAWVGKDVGDELVPEHDEADLGLEEVYIVISGRATFTVDGIEVDAPAGTIVYPHDAAVVRRAVAAEPLTTILAAGGSPGEVYTPNGWETNRLVVMHLKDHDYDQAVAVMDEALRNDPANPYFLYNRACAKSLGGRLDEALEDLVSAFARDPSMRAISRDDVDLDALREHPRFEALTRGG